MNALPGGFSRASSLLQWATFNSHNLYRKFGFEVEGRLRDYALRDGVFVDTLSMARLRMPA
jgi:L-amino acid N-acyltransferase YncA